MKTNSKKSFKNVVFLLAILKMCSVFGQQLDAKKRIVIDVGHGGHDTGAVGINGILEKDIVLDISKEIISFNKTVFGNKLDIYLTRYDDRFISLEDRSRLAKVLNADVFVSLHCNASINNPKGIEVYAHQSKNGKVISSLALGKAILFESTQKLGFEKRGLKSANFQVLRETVGFCPSVLVEIGFVTNTDEADYFLRPNNIRAMALAILMGMYNYLNI